MKKIILVVAILGSVAGYAHAGEAYSEASDSRARGVMRGSSTMKLQIRDADPFQLRVPGAPVNGAPLPTRFVESNRCCGRQVGSHPASDVD